MLTWNNDGGVRGEGMGLDGGRVLERVRRSARERKETE